MFSLLITIISIVLVGLLAVATFYYVGGTEDRAEQARIAQKIAEATQLHGAMELSRADGNTDLSMTSLVQNGYLSTPLQDWQDDVTAFDAQDQITESICNRFNLEQGYNFTNLPSCSDPSIAQYRRGVCCVN